MSAIKPEKEVMMKDLEMIYREIQPKMYAFFYVKTSNKSVAEDLTHDVFYEACKGIHSFSGNSTLQTWLYSIAKNLLRKYYRSNKYKQNLDSKLKKETTSVIQSTEDIFLQDEETRDLIQKIQSLDDLQKELVILRIYGELSFKEIGQIIGKSENYARVTFHRIKLRIQSEMEDK